MNAILSKEEVAAKLESVPQCLHSLIDYDFDNRNWTLDGKPFLPVSFEESWREHLDLMRKHGLTEAFQNECFQRFGHRHIEALSRTESEQFLDFMSFQIQWGLLKNRFAS